LAVFSGLGVRVRLGRHVRVDADAEARGLLEPPGDRDHRLQLGGGLDVQESHAGADRLFELRGGLPHAGEHDRVCFEAGRESASQLAHGHDVGARAECLEDLQDPDVAVRLHRIADAVRHVFQGVVQGVVLGADQVAAVDVGGGADPLRDGPQQRGIEG